MIFLFLFLIIQLDGGHVILVQQTVGERFVDYAIFFRLVSNIPVKLAQDCVMIKRIALLVLSFTTPPITSYIVQYLISNRNERIMLCDETLRIFIFFLLNNTSLGLNQEAFTISTRLFRFLVLLLNRAEFDSRIFHRRSSYLDLFLMRLLLILLFSLLHCFLKLLLLLFESFQAA